MTHDRSKKRHAARHLGQVVDGLRHPVQLTPGRIGRRPRKGQVPGPEAGARAEDGRAPAPDARAINPGA
jgi:hypothetical protein